MGDFCCQAMKKVRMEYDRPLFFPVYISAGLNELQADRLALELYKATRGGRISEKNRGWVTVNYCPFCGKRLSKPEEDGDG